MVRIGPAGHAAKPCLAVTFLILEPAPCAGRHVRTRLYCHDRAIWKLRWFLMDFNYDADLRAAEELDDRRVVGLEGVIHYLGGGQGPKAGGRWCARKHEEAGMAHRGVQPVAQQRLHCLASARAGGPSTPRAISTVEK